MESSKSHSHTDASNDKINTETCASHFKRNSPRQAGKLYKHGTATALRRVKVVNTPLEARLSNALRHNLKELEEVVRKGVAGAFEAGAWSLLEIRDKRLYRETHATFADYCRAQFNVERSHGNRIMKAAQVLANLSPIGDIPMPNLESQVRPLVRLPVDQQIRAWKHAVNCSGRRVIAKQVQASVDSLYPRLTARISKHTTAENSERSIIVMADEKSLDHTEECSSAGDDLLTLIKGLDERRQNFVQWLQVVSADPAKLASRAQSMLDGVTEAVTNDPTAD